MIFLKKKKKSNDYEEFSKSIDTSSFSETQKKSTEKFMSDVNKSLKEEDKQLNTKKINKVEDVIKDGQSNIEENDIDGEKLYTFVNGQKYIVNGSENIRKIKELNNPNKNEISSLFDLEECYANGNIKKKTEKYTENNLYIEEFFDETGTKTKEDFYLINENRLGHENIYDNGVHCQTKKYYEGGEVRQSFYVDELQDGVEKVFDKDGNLIEEHTYKIGRNTYYKRLIDGKVSKEYAVEDELNKEEEEIMRIAKRIETSSDFVSLVEILPTDLSEFEGESYYYVTEDSIVLLKNGKEVARGYINISHYFNYWRDDEDEHEPQLYNEAKIVNGKQFTDYDDVKWGKQKSKIIATFWDDDEAEEFFKEYVKIKCKSEN